MRAASAKHRVGYRSYQYSRCSITPRLPRQNVGDGEDHSVEQQLRSSAGPGCRERSSAYTPYCHRESKDERQRARLRESMLMLKERLRSYIRLGVRHEAVGDPYFARVAEHLSARGLNCIAITAPNSGRRNTAQGRLVGSHHSILGSLVTGGYGARCARASFRWKR